MANYFLQGQRDAQTGQFYGYSLPCGKHAQSETRATYRAGWIANRASRNLENLPACFLTIETRFYFIVDVINAKPVYNVTNGESPKNSAGYHDLTALMRLKNDRFESESA